MSYLDMRVLDRGLEVLVSEPTRLIIGSSEAVSYDSAMAGALGAAIPVVVGPSNYLPTGRRVVVMDVANGNVEETGTAAFWCLVDDRDGRLLAAGSLGNPLAVEAGNAFTLTAFEIAIPGAVDAPATLGVQA